MSRRHLGDCGTSVRYHPQITQAVTTQCKTDDIADCLQSQHFNRPKRQKCPHKANDPARFSPPLSNKNRPLVIKKAMFKAHQFNKYPLDFLVHLLLLNPDYRQKRSDRREAIALVLQVLLYYTDLETMEIKIPRKGRAGFFGLSMVHISNLAKISISRVKSAVRDLKIAQYLIVGKRVKKNAAGEFRSINAHKKLTPLLWQHLGVNKDELVRDRKYKIENKKRAPVFFETQMQNIRRVVKKTISSVGHFTEKIPRAVLDIISQKTFGCPA